MQTPARTLSLRDSPHPGFVFLRFGALSLLTAALDNAVFYLVFRSTGLIALSQVVARALSLFFNYRLAGKAVFFSSHRHTVALPRYLMLALANLAVSYAGIRLLSAATPLGVVISKILVESALFLDNFAIQRAFIFRRAPIAEPAPPL